MGGVFSKASRPIKNFNVENRAQKVIENHKTKPKVAPRHKTTEEVLQNLTAG